MQLTAKVGELGMAQNFGSSEAGGYNEITKEYKADPSIENYVRLRRGNPEAEIEVSVVGGFESMFYMREELARYDIEAGRYTEKSGRHADGSVRRSGSHLGRQPPAHACDKTLVRQGQQRTRLPLPAASSRRG
ncbi:hypothetical protein [Bradyrhizobium sp. McL0615]|jgi:hypothetical protein|uniref:hypothetical protein n=1 Tax=Bradyrhizobium sp. McL0615 TaxID=3415673 RepID=UPI003CF0BD06